MENWVRLQLFSSLVSCELNIPLAATSIAAGFPSPAGDFIEQGIDLNKEFIPHPDATFYARVEGDSMINAGIFDGDLLIVDRSLPFKDQQIVVCCVDGEFTLKRLEVSDGRIRLMPANDKYKPIEITEGETLIIWGVVAHTIRSFSCTR